MAERNLLRRIIAIFDRSSHAKAEKELTQSMDRAGKQASDRFSTHMKRIGASIIAAFSIRAVVSFGKAAVQAAVDAQRVWASLAGTVESAGVSFAKVEPSLRAAADQWERITIHDDEAFAETLQRLIALSGDYAASVQNVSLVADVAARFFKGELAPAADLVGRAMTGNTRMLKQLGITAKDAQSALDELARRSMGAAGEEANTLSGKVAQLNTAWGNFKEAVGDAMIAAGGGTSVLDTLTASVRTATTAVADHHREIAFLGTGLIKLGEIAATAAAGPFLKLAMIWERASRALERLGVRFPGRGDPLSTDPTLGTSTETGAPTSGRPAVVAGVTSEAEKELERKAKAQAEREAEHLKQIERQIDIERRRAIAIQQGEAAVETLNRELFIENEMLKAGVDIGTAAGLEIQHRAGVLYDAAKVVEMLGKDALSATNAMDMLKDAFKQGGVAGAIALAKTAFLKVKEHVASAISEGAKALGALGSGNFWAAAKHAASAVQHGHAVNEWRKLAMGGGGGGGGGGATGGAGAMTAGPAGGIDRAGTTEAPGTEVHIYLDQLDPRDPRVQEFHRETGRMVTERFGSNASVTWHPRTGSNGNGSH